MTNTATQALTEAAANFTKSKTSSKRSAICSRAGCSAIYLAVEGVVEAEGGVNVVEPMFGVTQHWTWRKPLAV